MKIIFIILLSLTFPLYVFCAGKNILLERITHAHSGDFIVTEQGKSIAIIRVHSLMEDILTLEEISVPSHLAKDINLKWQNWIDARAPGHTSWVMYEIDVKNKLLRECYSFTRSSFIQIQDHFITSLFQQNFYKETSDMRKKIGPPPMDGELDLRPLWNPPLMVDGKQIPKASFDAYQTTWPKDTSELSQKIIELYFPVKEEYPFPFWIQIHGDHGSVFARVIDSGKNLHSYYRDIPRRSLNSGLPNPDQNQASY